jgi:hypothetical protein
VTLLALWPYYSFFSLWGNGVLDWMHRPLYDDLPSRLSLALIGVIALGFRWQKDHRDPLVLFFVFGVLTVSFGAVIGQWSWGRALPAVFIPAQLAAALAVVSGGVLVRRLFAVVTSAALLFGLWASSSAFGYVIRPAALPPPVQGKIESTGTVMSG